uniref:non-specific serine/threonine protein kinase n=1 Tax=Physcomitrium patens TaxID=3218 RepID=A0A2K1KAA8_PHYPA|nr:hypothetical protein PHYPA_009894 [Physcomitrium patens]
MEIESGNQDIKDIDPCYRYTYYEEVLRRGSSKVCEIDLLGALQHHNIISCKVSWADEDMNVSFIMKLINPGTLADHYKLVWEVCGIEHDIKCDNIFIDGGNGEVKIGIHRTLIYVAPEILEGDYNQLVDWYELVMSEYKTTSEMFLKIGAGKYPNLLQKISDPWAQAFTERCLAPACKKPCVCAGVEVGSIRSLDLKSFDSGFLFGIQHFW